MAEPPSAHGLLGYTLQVLLSELCISCSFAIVKRITSRNVFYCLSSYCIDKDRAKDK